MFDGRLEVRKWKPHPKKAPVICLFELAPELGSGAGGGTVSKVEDYEIMLAFQISRDNSKARNSFQLHVVNQSRKDLHSSTQSSLGPL